MLTFRDKKLIKCPPLCLNWQAKPKDSSLKQENKKTYEGLPVSLN